MADDPHAVAYLNLLAVDTVLRVHDGSVTDTDPPRPYVVVYFTGLPKLGDDLTGMSTETDARAYCHCVGETAASARIVAQRVEDALLDKQPVIAGRVVWPIRAEWNQPPIRDEYTGVPTQDIVKVFLLKTKRS